MAGEGCFISSLKSPKPPAFVGKEYGVVEEAVVLSQPNKVLVPKSPGSTLERTNGAPGCLIFCQFSLYNPGNLEPAYLSP